MTDKACIVTGASRGIGHRLALDLARDGARVALVARPSAKLDEAVAEARASSPASMGVGCDVRDAAAVRDLVAGVEAAWGSIDVLVNSAGIEPIASVADASVDEIEQTMRTNFLGMVHCVKAVLPVMRRQRHGSIVNLSSSAAWFPLPRGAAYCASKAAITAFSESLYAEVHRDGIQVLVVYPGFVAETDMAAGAPSGARCAATLCASDARAGIERRARGDRHPCHAGRPPTRAWMVPCRARSVPGTVAQASRAAAGVADRGQ